MSPEPSKPWQNPNYLAFCDIHFTKSNIHMEKGVFNFSRLIWILQKACEANTPSNNQKTEEQEKENA